MAPLEQGWWLFNSTQQIFSMRMESPTALSVNLLIKTSPSMKNEIINGLIAVLIKQWKTWTSPNSNDWDSWSKQSWTLTNGSHRAASDLNKYVTSCLLSCFNLAKHRYHKKDHHTAINEWENTCWWHRHLFSFILCLWKLANERPTALITILRWFYQASNLFKPDHSKIVSLIDQLQWMQNKLQRAKLAAAKT